MIKATLLRALTHDASGAALVEFALVVPALLALLIAILEIAVMHLAQSGLETAVESSSRLVLTGQVALDAASAADFKTRACEKLPSFLDCKRLMIDVQSTSSFSSTNISLPQLKYDAKGNVINAFSYAPGQRGAITVVRFMYLWPGATAPLGFSTVNQPGGRHLLVATSLFRSETY